MKNVLGLASKAVLKIALLGSLAALAGPGCTAGEDPKPEPVEGAVDGAAVADPDTIGTLGKCDNPFGAPVPASQELNFDSCLTACEVGGGDPGTCRRDCCFQYTGCFACYVQ